VDVGKHKAFHGIAKDRFRHHYNEKAAQWLTEQAMVGRQHCGSAQFCASFFFPLILSTYIVLLLLLLAEAV
jgi:hypothetical protein